MLKGVQNLVLALSTSERVRVRVDISRVSSVCTCSPSRSLKSLRFRLRISQSDPYCLNDLIVTCLKSFSTKRLNILALITAFGMITAFVSEIIGFTLQNFLSKTVAYAIGGLVGAIAILPEIVKYYGLTRVKVSKLREYFKMLTATDNLCRESYSLAQEIMMKLRSTKSSSFYTALNGEEFMKNLRSKYGMIIDLSLKKSLT